MKLHIEILLILTAAMTAMPQTDADLCKLLQTDLQASLVGKKNHAASAAVVLADGRSCTAVSGQTDFSKGRKLTSDDPILAGSIGKTFVSALAMQLVQEDRLELDQKISK